MSKFEREVDYQFEIAIKGSERYFNHSAGGGVGGGGGSGGSGVINNSHNGNGRLTDCDDIDLPVRCEVCDKPFHDVDQ